jgi:hypothetical protein
VFAAAVVASLGLGLVQDWLIAGAKENGFSSISTLLEVISYGHLALGAAEVWALFAIGARGAAGCQGVLLVVFVGQQVASRVLFGSLGVDSMQLVYRLIRVTSIVLGAVSMGLLLAFLVRLGRSAQARWVPQAALAAAIALAARSAMGFAYVAGASGDALGIAHRIAYWGCQLLLVGMCVALAKVVTRLPEPPEPSREGPAGTLAPTWRDATGAIDLYLGTAGVRIAFAIIGYLVMLGARGASSVSSLRPVRDGAVILAVLSTICALVMMASVLRLARVSPRGAAAAQGALAFMVLGLGLDLVTTGITASALGGSVSSAFFAMKALPILAAIAAFLGVGAGACLLGCFGALAEDLGLAGTVSRAHDTRTLLYVTGAIAGVLQLAATKLPVALLLIGALVVLPLAIGVLVQFLRVMLAVRREVQARISS